VAKGGDGGGKWRRRGIASIRRWHGGRRENKNSRSVALMRGYGGSCEGKGCGCCCVYGKDGGVVAEDTSTLEAEVAVAETEAVEIPPRAVDTDGAARGLH